LQYYFLDAVNVIKSKDKNDWVFRPDYVIFSVYHIWKTILQKLPI